MIKDLDKYHEISNKELQEIKGGFGVGVKTVTSKPSTTNCPKLSSGLPPPKLGVWGPVTQTLSCVFF